MIDASEILTEPVEKYYYLFSKSGFTPAVEKEAAHHGFELITPERLFI